MFIVQALGGLQWIVMSLHHWAGMENIMKLVHTLKNEILSNEMVYSKPVPMTKICGLYYKHMTIVNDDSSIISEQSFQLIDDARGVIYDRRMFIIQATDLCQLKSSKSMQLVSSTVVKHSPMSRVRVPLLLLAPEEKIQKKMERKLIKLI